MLFRRFRRRIATVGDRVDQYVRKLLLFAQFKKRNAVPRNGMNALFLFVCSGVVARVIQTLPAGHGLTLKEWLFQALARLPLTPVNASLLFALLFNLSMFAVAWLMWRRKWFVKV